MRHGSFSERHHFGYESVLFYKFSYCLSPSQEKTRSSVCCFALINSIFRTSPVLRMPSAFLRDAPCSQAKFPGLQFTAWQSRHCFVVILCLRFLIIVRLPPPSSTHDVAQKSFSLILMLTGNSSRKLNFLRPFPLNVKNKGRSCDLFMSPMY